MEPIIIAVGLVLIIEGLPYFCAPDYIREIAKKLQETDSSYLRVLGFALMLVGLVLIYVAKRYISS